MTARPTLVRARGEVIASLDTADPMRSALAAITQRCADLGDEHADRQLIAEDVEQIAQAALATGGQPAQRRAALADRLRRAYWGAGDITATWDELWAAEQNRWLSAADAATAPAAPQLDLRTTEQKDVDAGRVLDAAFEATPMPAAFGPRDVAGTFAEWIAADPGRLDAFLADHPEVGA